jgi:hypothetical protein
MPLRQLSTQDHAVELVVHLLVRLAHPRHVGKYISALAVQAQDLSAMHLQEGGYWPGNYGDDRRQSLTIARTDIAERPRQTSAEHGDVTGLDAVASFSGP